MMAANRFLLLSCLLFLLLFPAAGQELPFVLTGRVTGSDHQPLSGVNIRIKNSHKGTYSDQQGRFKLRIHPSADKTLIFSRLDYETTERSIPSGGDEVIQVMQPAVLNLPEVQINKQKKEAPGTTSLSPLLTRRIAGAGGNAVEQLIATLPGVSSHNELSPQYSVRGGNFNENLLYVNGIEIYRPFLVKTGEQEGLSFLNPELVSAIRFSPGGFESSYGDKMSSVLDIDYKVPARTAGSAEAGALGASAHLEGRALHNKFSWLSGIRYRDNRYLLGTLDQKGRYSPAFFDFQASLGYDFSPTFSLNLLANISSNQYLFTPETRETRFGTMSQAYLLKIYFEGNEKDRFSNQFGALSAHYCPAKRVELQLTASAFRADEKERYDILGQYYLNEVVSGTNPGATPDSTLLLGVGSSLVHAGNFLQATIRNLEHKGSYQHENHRIQWGVKYQSENIHDQVSEWEMRDSAGFSLPSNTPDLILYRSAKANHRLNSNRFSLFAQDQVSMQIGQSTLSFNFGGRLQYWDFNQQTIFSPRLSVRYYPGRLTPLALRAAWGVYQQMPFFKELKDRQAAIVTNVRAQQSIHYVVGADYPFSWGDRPFKFSTELWYKSLKHLIPYKVANLDLQYFPEQQAHGYATGLELKLSGEPVPGTTSWASLTLMKTEEDIADDSYQKPGSNGTPAVSVYPGFIPRPTDQRFNFSLFFQDYLPQHPTVRMNLTLLYGSGLPFGPPQGERRMDTFRIPAYKRVDVGISKMITVRPKKEGNLPKYRPEAWLTLELFNLFDLNNTISYYWVSDFQNQQHAVPNYLTGRRINLKMAVSF